MYKQTLLHFRAAAYLLFHITSFNDAFFEKSAVAKILLRHTSCFSVDDMRKSNKAFTTDYDQAIADGYNPCGRCKP